MKRLKHQFEILKSVAFVTYKEWSAYRTHSLVSVFVGPIYFIVQYFIWTAVYGNNSTLAGMELKQIIQYFGALALIGYLTMDFADWNLQMLVRTGKFLTFTLRPIQHRFFALSQKIGHRILGFLFEFLPCFIIFTLFFGSDMMPVQIGWTIISIILAFFMNFYINYCLGLLAFWLVQANSIRHIFIMISNVFSGAVIPLVFFPKELQSLSLFLPFQYTSYVPAMVWTGNYTLAGITMSMPEIILLQTVAVIVVFMISELLYRASIKRFTGVGA